MSTAWDNRHWLLKSWRLVSHCSAWMHAIKFVRRVLRIRNSHHSSSTATLFYSHQYFYCCLRADVSLSSDFFFYYYLVFVTRCFSFHPQYKRRTLATVLSVAGRTIDLNTICYLNVAITILYPRYIVAVRVKRCDYILFLKNLAIYNKMNKICR